MSVPQKPTDHILTRNSAVDVMQTRSAEVIAVNNCKSDPRSVLGSRSG